MFDLIQDYCPHITLINKNDLQSIHKLIEQLLAIEIKEIELEASFEKLRQVLTARLGTLIMNEKIKILTVNTSGLNKNGITTVIYDYYATLDKNNFDIDIIAAGKSDPSVINAFNKIDIYVHMLPSRKDELIKYIIALIGLFVKEKYNIIYVHGSSTTMAIELFIASIFRCKVRIAHSHNTTCDAQKANKLLRPLFNRIYSDAFACGQLAGEWLFPKRKFSIIKNGRDVQFYRFNAEIRNKMRKNFKLSEKTLAIGHIGNFNEQKNHQFLIYIFNEVKKKREDTKLFLAGYGHTEKEIRKLVSNLELDNDVVFLGTLNNVPDVLQAMDVMLLPSLFEGLPLVVIEWQICALPCVISDSITKECVYTELVNFMSLEDSYLLWAEKVLSVDINQRFSYAEEAVRLTYKNDYDIILNAEKLKNIFLNAL